MKRVHIRIERIIPLASLSKGYLPAGTSSFTMLDHERLELVTTAEDLLVFKVSESIIR